MAQIAVEQAQASDTEDVSSILQEVANWLIDQGTPLWKADELLPGKIRSEVSNGMFWLAKIDGEIAGCVRFQLEDKLFWPDVSANESAFIHRLAVRRKYAGGIVSKTLIDWAKEYARTQGRKYLRLDCESKREKLCHVYEQNGFRKHSETQVGPYGVTRYEYELES